MSQTRLSIPKSRMNLAVEDKETRLYRRYWEGEYKTSGRVSSFKKSSFGFYIVMLLSFFAGVLVSFFGLI
ncbi:hypothetical protein Q7M76_03150 [Candidatus Liberibacter asiaticus]|uniref:Uncharacterized protein n=1 Tax=Liberibacter asiaticus (strain psy62) TaxID=537021 RepID=C6XF86_LIBAP|nr:hypothetical protein [Candidatus Liberibacter asiaticus]ACT57038.1 hypothetical protein CLIBASIA_02260 [Candidatus Liberibacter asiaticus str. psy62]ALK07331.1 hypothetical protein CD16_03165 [Candidatus Liberibacter asiaticus]AWL14138.1 hypothetical protein DIC79_03235 [Candidatus Liberibacter asiaticus]KAE9510055.1 hypothetical protein FXW22_03120 [Candidatus Liberibacter asiaticus]KAE9510815.1 hypothetical protein FXW31_04675 [Candidatus Liberibacter asiaticus]